MHGGGGLSLSQLTVCSLNYIQLCLKMSSKNVKFFTNKKSHFFFLKTPLGKNEISFWFPCIYPVYWILMLPLTLYMSQGGCIYVCIQITEATVSNFIYLEDFREFIRKARTMRYERAVNSLNSVSSWLHSPCNHVKFWERIRGYFANLIII